MPAIILPGKAGQPTTPEKINWGHPYSAGLTYAGDLRGSHVHDLVSGKVDTSIFAANPKQAQGFGPVSGVVSGAYNATSTGGRTFYGPGSKLAPIESTHLLVMRVDGVSGAYGGIICAADSTGTDTYWALQDSGSGSQINLWTTNSLAINFQTLAQMADGAVHAWAIAKDTAGNNNRVFRDGVFRTVFGGALTSYSPPANAKINYFGARDGSSAYGSYGLIALHMIWDRQLPDSALADLTRNPWQLFSKQKIYFFPSAGGGGATGTGAPAAQSATVAGTATRTVTGSGTPTAQAATAAGTAEREITSSGTPAAQSATVSGTGTVGAVVTGSGSPQAQSATVAGTAERTVTASGTVAAQSATVAGTAEREITSSGTPTAQSATVVGTGQVGNIISGSGTPTAQSATVSGAAEREITASGTVAASSATVVGTAERTITGSGTLSASSATVYGFDSAPVSGNPTSGGGTGKVYSSKKLRREVDEWLEKQQEAERQKILARIQREDEELLVIMLALAA